MCVHVTNDGTRERRPSKKGVGGDSGRYESGSWSMDGGGRGRASDDAKSEPIGGTWGDIYACVCGVHALYAVAPVDADGSIVETVDEGMEGKESVDVAWCGRFETNGVAVTDVQDEV